MKQRILTGITTTGTPHIGNYVGAIRPAIKLSHEKNVDSFFFLANLHALVKCQKPEEVRQSSREIAASWLALGLDVEKAVFYQQSDIPEISELAWILSCVTAKGLMNRSHAYKAAVAENAEANDPDKGVTMGLFSYPILMSADILIFNPHKVPVGRDQVQHLEMARDIGQRFNHIYGETFTLPDIYLSTEYPDMLMGLDGRKMSKSYHNTIPLFSNEKDLLKLIRKIKTDSLEPGEPKDPANSSLFSWYQAFASADEVKDMRTQYEEGISWGAVKDALFEVINRELKEPRERYEEWMADPKKMDRVLLQGAEKARAISVPFLQDIKKKVGIG